MDTKTLIARFEAELEKVQRPGIDKLMPDQIRMPVCCAMARSMPTARRRGPRYCDGGGAKACGLVDPDSRVVSGKFFSGTFLVGA